MKVRKTPPRVIVPWSVIVNQNPDRYRNGCCHLQSSHEDEAIIVVESEPLAHLLKIKGFLPPSIHDDESFGYEMVRRDKYLLGKRLA